MNHLTAQIVIPSTAAACCDRKPQGERTWRSKRHPEEVILEKREGKEEFTRQGAGNRGVVGTAGTKPSRGEET